ncbi:MAG: serine hydrolase [Acidimicrobiales bacterium]
MLIVVLAAPSAARPGETEVAADAVLIEVIDPGESRIVGDIWQIRDLTFLYRAIGDANSDLENGFNLSVINWNWNLKRGVKEIAERDMVTAGAASIYSTPTDMARFLRALLGEGSNEHGTVLEPETMVMMFEAPYRPDPRLPGVGLAFFRTDVGGQIVVGPQGSLPGFHSQISLAPDAGLAVMAFTNGARQADLWLPGEVSGLLGQLLGIPTDQRKFPHHPEVWNDVCGWYRLPARLTDFRLRGMVGAGVEVFIRGGRLALRFLTPIPELAAGFDLHPDDEHDPYVYRIDLSDSGLDHMRIVFGQDSPGMTTRMHFDLMPLTLEKQPPSTNPRRWATYGLAVGAAMMVARRLWG